MMHFISICTKNREDDVFKLLSSIAKSELPTNLSILIADSTDPLDRLENAGRLYVESFPQLAITHFHHEGGLPSARNACLNLVGEKGTVHFFDDDVEIAANFFSAVEKFFALSPDSVGCGPRIRGLYLDNKNQSKITENQGKLLLNGRNYWVRDDLKSDLQVSWIPGCAMSFKLEAIRKLQFNASLEKGPGKNYALGEDLEFTHRVNSMGKLFALSDTYVYHNYAPSKRDDFPLMAYASGKFMLQLKKQFPKEISIFRALGWKYSEIVRQNMGTGNINIGNLLKCLALFSKGLVEEGVNPIFDPSQGNR